MQAAEARDALGAGAHIVELMGAGEPRTIPVTIVAGTQASQYVELQQGGVSSGQLQVRTDPAGARVKVGTLRFAHPTGSKPNRDARAPMNEEIPATDSDRRLPVGDEIFLDHVGHFVDDPESASRALARAGFAPTPVSIQVNPDPAGGAPRATGTGNVTAMLDRGYLEVLFKTADTPLGRELDAALGRYRGVHLSAFAVADAGAFAVVIEAVAEPLGRRITGQVPIPTIGIGASAACDGQILVLEDMLGLSPRVPKFVKRYGDLGPGIETAIQTFAKEVRSRAFPGPEHVYPMRPKGK